MERLSFILILAGCIILYFGFNKSPTIPEVIEDMESRIGDTVIIAGDTSIILDFSFFYSTYTLSNGIVINQAFVK